MTTDTPRYADTVVLGGGTAGAVVAGLLTELTDQSVLLIEAGPDYGPYDEGRWPADLLDARDLAATHGWEYTSGDQYGARVVPFDRARVLGGCSSHNGCAAIWGSRLDYDGWAAAGNDGWTTEELLPLFRHVNQRLRVRIPPISEIQPFHRAYLDAAAGAGVPLVDDLNHFDEEIGIAPSPVNIFQGVRWNTAFGYLDPVRDRSNLTILDKTLVDRLVVEHGRVTGVRVVGAHGAEVIAAGRVVLSGGAYGSPAMLLRSGIGDPAHLSEVGIPTVHDLPGVGRNLHDHPAVDLHHAGTPELIERLQTFGRDNWLPEEQVIAKFRSSLCQDGFDIHLYPVGGCYDDPDRRRWTFVTPVACMTPRSRGRVTLRGAAPDTPPALDHAYVSDLDGLDRRVLIEAIGLARFFAAVAPLKELAGAEIAPGPGCRSDRDLADWIDANVVHYYHPSGSCKMGPAADPEAVVDARGKLHGLAGAYVADASIMPVIPRANTNVPAAVVGERIARWLAE